MRRESLGALSDGGKTLAPITKRAWGQGTPELPSRPNHPHIHFGAGLGGISR